MPVMKGGLIRQGRLVKWSGMNELAQAIEAELVTPTNQVAERLA